MKTTFEDIWNESELLQDVLHLDNRIELIKGLLDKFKEQRDPKILGEVLFFISGLSKDFDINVAAHLNAINQFERLNKFNS